jgi:flagellar motor protein MotB
MKSLNFLHRTVPGAGMLGHRLAELRALTTPTSQQEEPMPSRRINRIVLICVFLAMIPLAACGGAPAGPARVIVLLASATRNETAPVLAPGDLGELRAAGETSSDAVAYVVDASTGQSVRVPLTPRRPDGQVDYGPDRDQVQAADVHRVVSLVGREAADQPFDLLSWIASATRVSSARGTLIVVSSGLSTAGAFDLRQVGWDADPGQVAAQLKQRGELPGLGGWHVVFSGLGDAAGAQPALPLPQRATLVRYWLALCRAAGAASCRADEITRPGLPSHSRTPVPIVPVPRVVSVQGPRGWTGPAIPDDTFFAFGSARLLPGADAILTPLARQAASMHRDVSISGFASPDGGSVAYNARLSLSRAISIKMRLISLGLPPAQIVSVTGQGTAGRTAAACEQDGHLDEALCAQLRRVVILLGPAQPGTDGSSNGGKDNEQSA